jgi:hypothetical protein
MSEFLDTEPSLKKAIEITQKLTDNDDYNLPEKEVSSLEKVVQVVKELANDNNVSESLDVQAEPVLSKDDIFELNKRKFKGDMLNKELSYLYRINYELKLNISYYDEISKKNPQDINDWYHDNNEKNNPYLTKKMPESLPNDESRNNLLKNINKIDKEKLSIVLKVIDYKVSIQPLYKFERKSFLLILTCDSNKNIINNNQYLNEINNLKSKFENEKIHEIHWNDGEEKKIIEKFKNIIDIYSSSNCDITFCGSYGNVCVIKTLVITANTLKNRNNNYYFSFMGTRFSKGRLFETETPSICNVYSSFKKGLLFDKGINTGNDKNYSANKLNLLNHKYWINESIDKNKKIEQPIKIRFLDYEGKLYKPKGEKDDYDFFIEIAKTRGGKNRKTRKIKAKKTRKLRVKKHIKSSRKRSLR